MSVWLHILLYNAITLYWIAAVAIVSLRNHPFIQRISRYGTRQVSTRSARPASFSLNAGKPRASLLRRLFEAVPRLAERSMLGRHWISRRMCFCSFYICGLMTCWLLWARFPQTPCWEASELSIKASLGMPLTLGSPSLASDQAEIPLPSIAHRRNSRRGSSGAERFAVTWKKYAKDHPWLRDTPFLGLRNISRIVETHQKYEEEAALCNSFIHPTRGWDSVPLFLFAFHCFLRLLESSLLQSYSRSSDNFVTPFAFIAGCSFYVAAAISISPSCLSSLRRELTISALQSSNLLPTENATTIMRFSEAAAAAREVAQTDLNGPEVSLGGLLSVCAVFNRMGPVTVPRVLLTLIIVAYLSAVWVQTVAHEVLAALRRGPSAAETLTRRRMYGEEVKRSLEAKSLRDAVIRKKDSNDTKLVSHHPAAGGALSLTEEVPPEEAMRYTREQWAEAVGDEKMWAYQYPSHSVFFRVMLEPHYACEIFLFFLHSLVLLVLVFYTVFCPAARSRHMPLLPWFEVPFGYNAVPSFTLTIVLLEQASAMLGLAVFSCVNLYRTSCEHREFWLELNRKRLVAKDFVLSEICEAEVVDATLDSEGIADEHRKSVQRARHLERRVIHRRHIRGILSCTDPELLPAYNLCPFIALTGVALTKLCGRMPFTLKDFFLQLQRSPVSHIATLFHANQLLFAHREDVFMKAIMSLTWGKGVALIAAARRTQTVPVNVYRAMLARMVLHNRYVQSSLLIPSDPPHTANHFVPWQVALTTYSESMSTHGMECPPVFSRSALRLLLPHQRWKSALSILQLEQANGRLTKSMLLEAARVCAIESGPWEVALRLCLHVHEQDDRLSEAIGSLVGPSPPSLHPSTTALEEDASQRLLALPSVPSSQLLALNTLVEVVAAVPHSIAVDLPLCQSLWSHLAAANTLPLAQKSFYLKKVTRQLPWRQTVALLTSPSDSMLAADSNSSSASGDLLLQATLPTVKDVSLLATVLSKMPPDVAVQEWRRLKEASAESGSRALRHPTVTTGVLTNCVKAGRWDLALSLVHDGVTTIPSHVLSEIILLLRKAKAVHSIVGLLHSHLVPSQAKVTTPAITAALESVLAFNRIRVDGTVRHLRFNWLSALNMLQFQQLPTSSQGPSGSSPVVPLTAAQLRLALLICVEAGSTLGAIKLIGYASATHNLRLPYTEEITALLYCALYKRPAEATAILKEAEKKNGKAEMEPLYHMLSLDSNLGRRFSHSPATAS